MYNEEKLNSRLSLYYEALAQEETLSDREREKLVKDINREIERINKMADRYREAHKKLVEASDELSTRLRDTEKSTKRHFGIKNAPANGTIDFRENQIDHFARGINFYKLFIIFFSGSFVGVLIELLWCYLRNGYFESRSGLVYGPFNLVYGIGALVLTMALYRYRNRSWTFSFIGGFVTGSVIEYFCSFFQELLFGSTSWDYSNIPFNLNGRICLLYSVFWGVLGIFWIKKIYPRIAGWILRIPDRVGKTVVWILLAFMVVNSAVSGAAVYRWAERTAGKEASGSLERVLDERFPDERMERIYANLEFT
ncbi:MAG: putative ABC transporter permease [Bullifex sp.]|nr:putative ABC transporter permease [Spirochaetales bacterium]MDY4798108.1 putative ABC transporter permease [Bullifex sp.]MDY5776635.1 putative ABC transporter permease [Bullifex sp.]